MINELILKNKSIRTKNYCKDNENLDLLKQSLNKIYQTVETKKIR